MLRWRILGVVVQPNELSHRLFFFAHLGLQLIFDQFQYGSHHLPLEMIRFCTHSGIIVLFKTVKHFPLGISLAHDSVCLATFTTVVADVMAL